MTLHKAFQRKNIPTSAYLKTGYSQSENAKKIGKSKTTMSQELKRNSGRRGFSLEKKYQ